MRKTSRARKRSSMSLSAYSCFGARRRGGFGDYLQQLHKMPLLCAMVAVI